MGRPILLFSGPWADQSLESLAAKAAGWGYAGFELCSWGDHLEVQRGLSDDGYALLLERCLPGTDLWSLSEREGNAVGVALLQRLWRRVPALGVRLAGAPYWFWLNGALF